MTQSAIVGWQTLPSGQDVAIRKGYTYALLASVSNSYPKATILSHVPQGVELLDYAEQGERPDIAVDPDSDHRTIAAKFFATADAGTLPWKSPWPTTIYHLNQAWWASGAGQPAVPPTAPPSFPWPWVLGGVAAAGGLALYLWRRRRKR